VASELNSSAGKESAARRLVNITGLGRVLPKPRGHFLPAHAMPNTSPQSILERSNRDGCSTDIASNTLSVHFSLDVPRPSRGPTVTDTQEMEGPFDSTYHSKQAATNLSPPFSYSDMCGQVNGDIEATESCGRVTTSRVGRRGKPGNPLPLPHGSCHSSPFQKHPTHSNCCCQVDHLLHRPLHLSDVRNRTQSRTHR
jgi:hypothetical protein